MDKRNELLSPLVVLAAVALCGSGCGREHEREAAPRVSAPAADAGAVRLSADQIKATGVQTAPVAEQESTPILRALGRVAARAGGEAQVFSPFPGRLIADPERLPRVGTALRRGERIAEVEQLVPAGERVQFGAAAAAADASVRRAEAELAFRRNELERARQLHDGGAIPAKQLQAAELAARQAETELDGARRTRAEYRAVLSEDSRPRRAPIRAPISGVVVSADLTAGEQRDTSKPLLTIVDLGTVWIEVPVHESDLPLVRRAERIELVTPAVPGRRWAGRVVAVGSVVDPSSRTLDVTFEVRNPDASLKLGMTAEARVPTGPPAKALLAPSSAMLYEEGQTFVYVEESPGLFRRRAVKTGELRDDTIVILSGLRPTERIVSVGAQALRSESLRGQIPSELTGDRR